MTTSDELIAVLSETPDRFELYLIIADLLEDEDNYRLSIAYRWCGMNGKRPGKNPILGFMWFTKSRTHCRAKWYKDTQFSRLPITLDFQSDINQWQDKMRGDTFQEAMIALSDYLEFAGIL